MKILVIPSWFSLDGAKGSFFREQAEVLSDGFDFRFLFGEEKNYGYKLLIKSIFSFKRVFKLNVHEKKNVTYYLFECPVITFLPLKLNIIVKKWFYKFQFEKISRKYNWTPDLIHAQSTFYGAIISNYISTNFNIPFIITEHGLFMLGNYHPLWAKQVWLTFKKARKVLVVSTDKIRQILMHFIEIEPIIVGNLVDNNVFYYKPKNNDSPFTITIVADFAFSKDYPTFFKTMMLVKEKAKIPFQINCVGFSAYSDEDATTDLLNLAKSYKIDDLHLVPKVDRDKINSYYWASDIFVLTSIQEGLPLSSLEALACGVPVFATRSGGIEDIVNDSNGRTVTIKDAETLAQYILDFMSGKISFDKEQISKNIISKYGRGAFRKRLTSIYNEAVIKSPAYIE